MIRNLILSLFTILTCAGQVKKEPAKISNAFLLSKTVKSSNATATESVASTLLYTSSPTGDEYFAYTLTDGIISDALGYRFAATAKGLFFIAERLFSNQNEVDSLQIRFDDAQHLVHIGKGDRYQLFPSSYLKFKQEVNGSHKILSFIGLLEDNLGDYPIAELLPLIAIYGNQKPALKIKQAQVSTARSQSDDILDTWQCNYKYGRTGKILFVKAFNEDGLRFTKNVSYEPDGGLVIKSHRNIEDRQITDRILLMQASTPGKLKWTDRVMQSGKNVETTLVTEILTKAVFSVEQAKMNQQEVLNLLKKKQ